MLELKPITINSACHYIKGSTMKGRFGRFLRVPKVLHNICNMCDWDLPDMFCTCPRALRPLGVMRTYQANPSRPCYI